MHGNHPAGLQIRTKVFDCVSVEWINRFLVFIAERINLTQNMNEFSLALAQLNFPIQRAHTEPGAQEHSVRALRAICIIQMRFFLLFTFFARSSRSSRSSRCLFTFTCGFCFLRVHKFAFFCVRNVCVCLTTAMNFLYAFLLSRRSFVLNAKTIYINFSIHRKVSSNSNKF